jgi:PAS domain S-box-containing protein
VHGFDFESIEPGVALNSLISLFDQMPNPVFIKQHSGHYLFVNEALEEFWGYSADQIIGKLDEDFLPILEAKECIASDQQPWDERGKIFTSFETRYAGSGRQKQYISVNKRVTTTDIGNFLVGVVTVINV